MSAQKDCEFLVKRARELVSEDPCAAKAWLITARTLYPADFTIQVRARQQSNVNVCVIPTNHLFISYTECLIFISLNNICPTFSHSMKCILLNEMQKGLLQQGDFCMICKLKTTITPVPMLCYAMLCYSCYCYMSTLCIF